MYGKTVSETVSSTYSLMSTIYFVTLDFVTSLGLKTLIL